MRAAQNRLQSYEKKCTFANIREEKLQFTAFFSGSAPFVLAQEWGDDTKKGKRSFIFLRETLPKCTALPCCNFEVGRQSRVGVLEVTKESDICKFICKNRTRK